MIKSGLPQQQHLIMSKGSQQLERFIFWSRWLQAPLYLGLIVAQGIYVYLFMAELGHLIASVFESGGHISETETMLVVLGLIDVVMIANLLIMVIIGGYETFVSRLELRRPPGPAGMAVPCQRRRAEDQAVDGHHRHLLDPPAEDLHQCRQPGRAHDHVAGDHPCRVPAVRPGHGLVDKMMNQTVLLSKH
jgi:hypothetical protein